MKTLQMTDSPMPLPLPLEADEQAAELRRLLSVSEAVIVLRDECPDLRDVTLSDTECICLRDLSESDPGIRVRGCILSAVTPVGMTVVLYGPDWATILDDARQQFGNEADVPPRAA